MPSSKIAVSIPRELLDRLDRLVAENRLSSRSGAVQEALRDKLDRLDRTRLARECAKLDRASEQKLADEGLAEDLARWPAY